MTEVTSRQLFQFLENQDFDWHAMFDGYYYYDSLDSNYELKKGTGRYYTLLGEMKHVKDWTEFDEGNERIFLVFSLGDAFFQAEIYNDSWTNDGQSWSLSELYRVKPQVVTEVKYVQVSD